MKSLLLLTIFLSPRFVLAESAIPEPYPLDRYQETLLNSPFVLATEKRPEEPPKDSPLNNLVLTGLGKADDGSDYVFVQRIGDDRSMRFVGNEANDQGISVKKVNWGDRWTQSSVVLKYKGEEETIRFKENSQPVMPPVVAAAGAPRPVGAPATPPVAGALPNAPRAGSITIPRPGQTQVPRPGAGVPLPSGANMRSGRGGQTAVPTPNGGAPRIRVRGPVNNAPSR